MNIFDPTGWFVQGFILVTGVVGQLYVARLNVVGFYYWLIGNLAVVAVSWHFSSFGLLGLYMYFSFMAVYSILHWKKQQELDAKRARHHAELIKLAYFLVDESKNSEGIADYAHGVMRAQQLLQEIPSSKMTVTTTA